MRKSVVCALMCCLLAFSFPAYAENTAPWTTLSPSDLAALTEAGEEIIAPEYDVPDHVEWLLDIARAELGYTEQRGNVTKYGIWAGDPAAEWCAEYLCWCVNQVDERHGTQLLTTVYPKYSSRNVGMRWFLKEGRYIARRGTVADYGSQWYIGSEETMEKNSYIPQPGDWIFFSSGSNGDTTHVAMVEFCTRLSDGSVYVHVLEGNKPDKVQTHSYRLEEETILGYGTVYDLADIVLRQGQQGKKVTALQQLLCDIGLLDASHVTGTYGAATTEAVKTFQKMRGKTATGIANHHTQLALQQYVKEYYLTHSEFWAVDE